MCVGDSADTSLDISWGEPITQSSGVVGYSVKAQRIIQQPSRDLVSIPLSPAYDEEVGEKQAEISHGLGM